MATRVLGTRFAVAAAFVMLLVLIHVPSALAASMEFRTVRGELTTELYLTTTEADAVAVRIEEGETSNEVVVKSYWPVWAPMTPPAGCVRRFHERSGSEPAHERFTCQARVSRVLVQVAGSTERSEQEQVIVNMPGRIVHAFGAEHKGTYIDIEAAAEATVEGGDGEDWLVLRSPGAMDAGSGNDTLWAFAPGVTAIGGPGDDALRSGDAASTLRGGDGDDFLYGFGGDDVLDGGLGADLLDGGAGKDSLSYQDRSGPVSVTVDAGADDGAAGELDAVKSVEVITGTRWDDEFVGGDGDETFIGLGGHDVIAGGGGTRVASSACCRPRR